MMTIPLMMVMMARGQYNVTVTLLGPGCRVDCKRDW